MSSNLPISSLNKGLLVSQKLAVNKDLQPNKALAVEADANQQNKAVTLEVALLKSGDNAAKLQADELFAQANSYAKVSPKVQQSLQAYESLEILSKREAISSLMGIDLYA
jgi:hypothetical protein